MAIAQVPISTDSFTHPVKNPAWKHKPTFYMVATEDRSINPDQERMMAKRAKAKTVEVKSSHVAYMAFPNLADLDRLYQTVKREKGKIDILFASAGFGELVKLEDVTEEHFDKTFDLNVRGTLFTVQKALPLFNDNGSIFLNGSIASIKGFPQFGVYSASKSAVRSFARTWLLELKERRIRVNILSPGTIDTPILDPLGEEAKEFFKSQIPRGEMGRPEEIATVALFLASSDSSFVNGIELFVDGGTAQV
jgi:NAD(P)-dependent dehydrogenase (short-subunit alcohol dehydrogenase family)